MLMTVETAKNWITTLNAEIQKNKTYLTDLDQAIGDGDHGINMARGFQEVVNKLTVTNYDNLNALFKDVGMTLISKVGGASGPLYGTAFMKMSMSLKNQKELDKEALTEILVAALEGLKMRGKAQVGDKTMIDVWEPVVYYFRNNEQVNKEKIIEISKETMESTKDIEARKGRAAYLGKRSIGQIDPGAASSYLFFLTLANTIIEGDSQS